MVSKVKGSRKFTHSASPQKRVTTLGFQTPEVWLNPKKPTQKTDLTDRAGTTGRLGFGLVAPFFIEETNNLGSTYLTPDAGSSPPGWHETFLPRSLLFLSLHGWLHQRPHFYQPMVWVVGLGPGGLGLKGWPLNNPFKGIPGIQTTGPKPTIIADVRNIPNKNEWEIRRKLCNQNHGSVWCLEVSKKNLTSFQSKKSHLTNSSLYKQITLNKY